MATKRKTVEQSSTEVIGAAADKLFKTAGQAWSDPLAEAGRLLNDVVNAAHAVIEAKGLYYEQEVSNEDALDVALLLWADRVDALESALAKAKQP